MHANDSFAHPLPPPLQQIDFESKLQNALPFNADAEFVQVAIVVATSIVYGLLAGMVNKACARFWDILQR
jgi:hypothetical protein